MLVSGSALIVGCREAAKASTSFCANVRMAPCTIRKAPRIILEAAAPSGCRADGETCRQF